MKQHRLLIEDWLPATAIGVECMRERSSASALSPLTFLHAWWARRPLPASRAAVLASLLPADFDRETFDRLLGMTGGHEQVEYIQDLIDKAKVDGVRATFAGQPITHGPRAFKAPIRDTDLGRARAAMETLWGPQITVMDPMAGGGSIPFEARRLGLDVIANDYSPVATSILEATIDYPWRFGATLAKRARHWAGLLRESAHPRLDPFFPSYKPQSVQAYIYARTVPCPDTPGNPPTPLVPDWHLVHPKTGISIVAEPVVEDAEAGRWSVRVREVGNRAGQISKAPPRTYDDGKGVSLYTGMPISSDYIKAMAQSGRMGSALYAVALKTAGVSRLEFRSPSTRDIEALARADVALRECRSAWASAGVLPTEEYPLVSSDERPRTYGMTHWADLFSPRQLLGFGVLVEELQRLRPRILAEEGTELGTAIIHLVAFAIDKFANWNAALSSWNVGAGTLRSVFDRHDFSFKATFAEMASFGSSGGFQWACNNVFEAYEEMSSLPHARTQTSATITQGSATSLPAVSTGSVTSVVVDPPYDDNVQYSELADFFYVWLKRTIGWAHPEWFSTYLSDRDEEAVVNTSRFRDDVAGAQRGAAAAAKARSRVVYQRLMAETFAECRRVLRDDGALTVMFTHKKQEAWEALFSALMNAGFRITASWPVRTEAQISLHQARMNSAESTVMLGACVGNGHRASLAHARIGHARQDLPAVRPGHPAADAPVGA